MSATPDTSPPSERPRFRWPVRILIFLVLFHMFFRSTDVLYPWADWMYELKIERMPRKLPTREELANLCEKADGSWEPAFQEFAECFYSLPRYWNPCPKEDTLVLLDAEQIRWGGLRLNKLGAKAMIETKLAEGHGLMVMEVAEGSAAEEAGLQVQDVLLKINDKDVPGDLEKFAKRVEGPTSEIDIEFVVLRDGKTMPIKKNKDGNTIAMPAEVSTTRWDNALLWLKYCLAWTATRLQWCECILNIDQEWPMFSPNVGKKKYPARARLLYADGTETLIRTRSDPGDLTCYFRWGPGKYLGYDRGVADDSGYRWYACPGWCNLLSHQFPVNANGAPLKEIRIYQVRYDFPAPGVDQHAFFKDLMAKTRDHKTESDCVYTTFFRYWPQDRAANRKARWEFVREVYRTSRKLTDLEK
jgi:hypothetical protein